MNTEQNREEIVNLELGVLLPSPTNPRKDFDAEEGLRLRASIREIGVRQPLVVRARGAGFEVVSGERRWRESGELELGTVPCVIREMSDEEVVVWQVTENVMRDQLNPMEEAEGVEILRGMGHDSATISRELGMSVEWVQDRFDLGSLPEVAKSAVRGGRLSAAGAQVMRRVDEGDLERFAQEVLEFEDEVLSSDALEELVRERYDLPRENRARWKEYGEELKPEVFELPVVPCGDPELWSDYVRPFGEGHGKWKGSGERVGGLAAKVAEESVTWGMLAKAHGIVGVLVPAGGVKVDFKNVVCVVDRDLVEAAERGARLNKGAFTLGPRVARKVEPVEDEPEEEEKSDEVEKPEDDVVPVKSGGDVVLDEFAAWNPWKVEAEWEPETDHLLRVKCCELVLDAECVGWRDRRPKDVELGAWLVFWILRSCDFEDRRLRKLAGLFGALELWVEGGGE